MRDWKRIAKTTATMICVGSTMAMAAIAAEQCPDQFGLVQLQGLTTSEPAQLRDAPANGHVRDFFAKLAQINACEKAVNHFAAELGLPDDLVEQKNVSASPRLNIRFGNRLHPELCGTVVITVPYGIEPDTPAPAPTLSMERMRREVGNLFAGADARKSEALRKRENSAFQDFLVEVDKAFFEASTDVSSNIDNLIQRFLPHGRYLPQPSTESLDMTIKSFELKLVESFRAFLSRENWSAAEVDHFVGRARCSPILPRVTPPEEAALATYKSAFETYRLFDTFMESEFKR